jgi:purine-nucleoside phosphorylase
LAFIRSQCEFSPSIAIILGSGLGKFADTLSAKISINTSQIPHYPVSTVEGHQGRLVFGSINKVPVLAVQGRTHYYEGHAIADVAYVVRLMAKLGIKLLIVTNAAGGVNPYFKPGDLMIITDHINFMFKNPLRGLQLPSESRWTDMQNSYDSKYSEIIEQVGLRMNIPLKRGVLFVSIGPTYETAAEVKMARRFGADAVSMSTVPEVITARANQIKVVGISCITNLATGLGSAQLSHNDVTDVASRVTSKFQRLLTEAIAVLGKKVEKEFRKIAT